MADLPPELPVVFFDSYLPGVKPLAFYRTGCLPERFAGQRLMKQTVQRSSGLVAVIKILPEDYHIAGRIEGFCRAAGIGRI